MPSKEGLWIAFRGRTWVRLLKEDFFLPPRGLDIPNLGTVSHLILDLGVLGSVTGTGYRSVLCFVLSIV